MGVSIESDPYGALGVRPFINCCGTRSVHGGSLIRPEVRAAMQAASRSFVNIDELMAAARRRIAALTGAEDGIVTAGSAAAIAIATAAAMAGNDPVAMLRLPLAGNHPRQVVMLRGHRFPYDQAVRMVGASVIEIDSATALEALDRAGVAMVLFLASRDSSSVVPLETLIAWGRRHGVPVLVDAASLPIRRPDLWLSRGADLVVYSGGKLLRGPQTSGLLLGRRDLIDAAWANSPPHRAFGRPMKIGKEEIIGLLAALEAWFARDTEAERTGWQADFDTITAIVTAAGISATLLPPDEGEDSGVLELRWQAPLHGLELRRRLLAGTPRIMLDDMSAGPGTIKLEVVSLFDGEAAIIGRAIVAALQDEQAETSPVPPSIDASGNWAIEVAFARRPRQHTARLRQSGSEIGGEQQSEDFAGPVSGRVEGNTVSLAFEASYEGAIIRYGLTGIVTAGEMTGEVLLGSTTPGTRGPVTYGQYGTVSWRGRRTD